MRLRDAHQGELTVYDRAEWEYRYGALPDGFPTELDKVYIDYRFEREDAVREDVRLEWWLPNGIHLNDAAADDLQLAAVVGQRMLEQAQDENDYLLMAREMMSQRPGHAVLGDIREELEARWQRERGTEPPIKADDEVEVEVK